jgi:superfamily II DNA or RNA helicase
MQVRLESHFDRATQQRGREYAARGLVLSAGPLEGAVARARVSNGRGSVYDLQITLKGDGAARTVEGLCSCPIGVNCKHVVAALVVLSEQSPARPGLPFNVQDWLKRAAALDTALSAMTERPELYPAQVKDRLLYLADISGPALKIAFFKGQINAAGQGLNKSMRRYDVLQALRNQDAPKFIRPVDLHLLGALVQTGLWVPPYTFSMPAILRPGGEQTLGVLQTLCETGRFLFDNTADAVLRWSDRRPDVQLGWQMEEDGSQKLVFQNPAGQFLDIHALDGCAIWIDEPRAEIGALANPVSMHVAQLIRTSPKILSTDAAALSAALPESLGGLSIARPRAVRRLHRKPVEQMARLTLNTEQARNKYHYWDKPVHLPALSLRFVYDGVEVGEADGDPSHIESDGIVTLARDRQWEAECANRLIEAGAVPIDALEGLQPSEGMRDCDFVFASDEARHNALGATASHGAIAFSFGTVPELRRNGWDIIETAKWPFRLSDEAVLLSVATRRDGGETFQGNAWFSLGFAAEIAGKSIDVAPLVAAFLEQVRIDWTDTLPDVDALRSKLAEAPVYLDRGKGRYVAMDLSPLAPLLHLFLTHHAELGALHPADAAVAFAAEEALAGSAVRFADHAGILPLARSLAALSQSGGFTAPAGLKAELRDYQSYGAAWMASLLKSGFGGVLADDMGLGKTVQTLALLQARREAGEAGPVLLIVPTSLLYSWQTQAAQFTPELRLLILHGPDRSAQRGSVEDFDLVMTTCPLLARDGDWLAARKWPLVILDEAQTLKNPASQMAKTLREIPAEGRLALTGTPLENSLQDVWTLIDWVVPGLLGDRKRFQTVFRTPIEKHGDARAQARLARRLRPFMLRRTKEEVAAELPPRTEILDRVEFSRAQQALYESVRSAMDERVRKAIGTRGLAAARITVLDALLKLRQVCCDPALVKTKAARSVTDSAKRVRLLALLEELVAEGRRVLVFSQFVEMLKLIEADLAEAGIANLILTGSTRDRAGVLKAFAEGDAPVFLLSLKAGGVGLTLTEADTVILYDPWWNPAVERQAMDRAHRIGQTKPVFVHRLVAGGTVEEKILDMQKRKQALADALFSTDGKSAEMALDEATLMDLFAPLS